MEEAIIFEHPTNEHIRSYLRLEHLFSHLNELMEYNSVSCWRSAFSVLLEILELLERGDTKAELIKELDRQIKHFTNLASNPQVDREKLDNFLTQLQRLNQWAFNHQGKFGMKMRSDPFLTSVRQRISIPGGCCSFDLPELHKFLYQPIEERRKKFQNWLSDIQGIQTSMEVILRLIRDSARF